VAFADGPAVIGELFPNARITSGYRGPNNPLSKKNPRSYHARTKGAVDIAPIPGVTFKEYISSIKNAGYKIIEARDEVKNPSRFATGPHWHVVIGN
jgi:soluble lytic murein transglycosylase